MTSPTRCALVPGPGAEAPGAWDRNPPARAGQAEPDEVDPTDADLGVEAASLRDEAHRAVPYAGRVAEDAHARGGQRDEPQDRVDHRGLARAVRAEHRP